LQTKEHNLLVNTYHKGLSLSFFLFHIIHGEVSYFPRVPALRLPFPPAPVSARLGHDGDSVPAVQVNLVRGRRREVVDGDGEGEDGQVGISCGSSLARDAGPVDSVSGGSRTVEVGGAGSGFQDQGR
jgi:hypothetical protein